MIRISVVVPIWNTPKVYLDQCIDSIKKNLEIFQDVEVLLINDCSTEPYIETTLKEVERANNKFK